MKKEGGKMGERRGKGTSAVGKKLSQPPTPKGTGGAELRCVGIRKGIREERARKEWLAGRLL